MIKLEEGKLSIDLLRELVSLKGKEREAVIVGPKIGSDAAVLDFKKLEKEIQEYYNDFSEARLIVKTDPITFSTPEPGKYVVIINSNDISMTGAIPVALNVTIILPPEFSYEELVKIQQQIDKECQSQGISLIGGHTEVSSAVITPVVSGAMLGLVPENQLITDKIQEGDLLWFSGWAGMEGISIIMDTNRSFCETLLTQEEIDQIEEVSSYLSVLSRALAYNKATKINQMHDPTEGGVLGAIYEMLALADFGVNISQPIPMLSGCKKLSQRLSFDPLKLISSGGLLIITPPESKEKLEKANSKFGTPLVLLGEVTAAKKLVYLGNEITEPEADHIIVALQNMP
ncbi:MAG: AIR synthase-related protein [Candidatus Kariarchaeaceae archaeon]